MAQEKRLVEEITPMSVDFAQWYTDICKKADLVDYSSVKGCMIIRPYGYAIWELMQGILDKGSKNWATRTFTAPVYSRVAAQQGEESTSKVLHPR